jgi:drug/metabolite transporter (DMT)-like permease
MSAPHQEADGEPATHAQGGNRHHLAGIALMVFATGLFTLMHAMTKTLASHYPALELTALRGMASIPFVLVWLCAGGAWRYVLRVRWPLQLLRGVSQLVTIGGVTFALKVLPIADAYAISFAAPLLVMVFSILLLRERADRTRWLAVLTGFVGVLIVLRPSGSPMFTLAGLAMLASAAGYAASILIVRVLVRTDSTVNLVFWVSVLVSIGAGLLALPDWHAIE